MIRAEKTDMSVLKRRRRAIGLTGLSVLGGLVLATAVAATPPPAAPASATAPAPPAASGDLQAAIAARIQALDGDDDGRISAAEHTEISRMAFAQMDRDGNGAISVAEIDAMRAGAGAKPSAAELMARIDRDGDGQLSAAEHASGGQAMFGQMDADADGFITAPEMQAAYVALSAGG